MSISYFVSGRFGNNLFQYFATKVLGKILNKEYVFNGSKIPLTRGINKIENMVEVDEEKFNEIISKNIPEYRTQSRQSLSVQSTGAGYSIEGNVYVVGFFQTQDWLTLHREYIQSLFTEENMDRINDDYTISSIVKHVNKIKPLRDDILIVHLRLDDFFHNAHNSEVIHPKSIIEEINKIEGINKIMFISDTLKRPWELSYVNHLTYSVKNSIAISNSLLTDFGLLYKAKNLMLCRSTLGWIACILSTENKRNWFPLNEDFKHQTINKLNEHTVTFTPEYLKSVRMFGENDIMY
jgi:hypothetical protein